MKKAAVALLSVMFNLLMVPSAQALEFDRFEAFCSNSRGSIVYHVTDDFDHFTVLNDFSIGNGLQFSRRQVIDGISIKVLEEREIESTWSSSCDDEDNDSAKGVKTLKNLSIKKVLVTKDSGEILPMGISGLSEDGKTLSVEYFCDERIREEVACN